MANVPQKSFASGELAPFLYARTDVAKYASGLRTCRNFIVQKAGGVQNRPGTVYVAAVPGRARLVPFIYSTAQTYLLVFTEGVITIYRDGGALGVAVPAPYLAAELTALQFAQSADVLTIVHPNHAPRELRRTGDTAWTLAEIVFAPSMAAPTNLTIDGAGATTGFAVQSWAVTAVSPAGVESLVSNYAGVNALTPVGTRTLTWTVVPGADYYNVYKSVLGGSPFLVLAGSSVSPSFVDASIVPESDQQPPSNPALFATAGGYPAAVSIYQQRRFFGGSNAAPETVWGSRLGDYANFTESTPVADDDAVTFTLAGTTVNRVRHLVDAETLFLFTDGGEKAAMGDGDGTITPTAIGLTGSLSRHGASVVPPVVLDDAILYVQARESVIRSLALSGDYRAKAVGADLTVYSTHLFEGHTITAWAYQEVPNSVLWCVRSDGVLLGLTYLPEQQLLAWHRHDTDGVIEAVAVVPEGSEDAIYLTVNRNGTRMLERMAPRRVDDITAAIFTDATLTYDGRNASATTMRLVGGVEWSFDEQLSLRASAATFVVGDVGNEYWLTGADGAVIRFRVQTYASPTVVLGFAQKTVPASLQSVETVEWARAVDVVTGLQHLAGRDVTVVSDGLVVANPNAPDIDNVATVSSNGTLSLLEPLPVIQVGLPYVCDLQTLDLDSPSGASVKEKGLLVNRVTVQLVASTGGFVGQALPTGADLLDGMDELQLRDPSDEYGRIAPRTESYDIGIASTWDTNGRVAIRHVDPTPLTVVGIIPRGPLQSPSSSR
jgi:hypothetical protein